MSKVSKTLRLIDWWEPKIVPLLFIYYLTIIQLNEDLITHFGLITTLIITIAIGASYVSILNDYTDLRFDLASKKANRLQNFSPLKRKVILFISALLSLLCCFLFTNNTISLILYLLSYLVFSLYSIPPIRLKNRGILGVIADASGAHLFPSLLVISYVVFKLETNIDLLWFSLIGIWAFTFGLRGILWHQFWDRENDLAINHKTFATNSNNLAMKPIEKAIMFVELGSLLLILFQLKKTLPLIVLVIYFLILIGYNKKLKIKSILIIAPKGSYHVFMTEYYLVLLPISLILSSSLQNPFCLLLIIFHLIMFSKSTILLVRRTLLIFNLKKKG